MASATVPNCDLALLAAALDEPDSDLGAVFKALSVRNQAIGVLIDQGNVSDEAVIELSRRANREGITMNQAAQVILDTLTVPVLPRWPDPLGEVVTWLPGRPSPLPPTGAH